jgi:hypothetical protein
MSLPSGLPEEISDGEPLARFLTSSGHFNSTVVKPSAFMPNATDGKTSVFRHGAEPRGDLVAIGRAEVAKEGSLHGAAILSAGIVRTARLEVEAVEPPPRHADITGWPWLKEDREFAKAERKEIAIVLAQNAQLLKFA